MERNKESEQTHTESRNAFSSRLTLTVADFFAGQVVSRGEAIFGHRHVGVKGQRQQAGRRLDLRRDFGPAVTADQRSHCKHTQIKKKSCNYPWNYRMLSCAGFKCVAGPTQKLAGFSSFTLNSAALPGGSTHPQCYLNNNEKLCVCVVMLTHSSPCCYIR